MGFRALRVINDDIVEAGGGFSTHAHHDIEIFSYVIEGELEHRDSLGNVSVIQAGNLQYISAGTGIEHSESNPSPTTRLHFLQMWLTPDADGGTPRYAEKKLETQAPKNALTRLFAGKAREGAMEIRLDAEIFFGKSDKGRTLSAQISPGRHAWLQIIKGQIRVQDEILDEGDGAAVSEAEGVEIYANQDSDFLFFNLA
jgi:quercetin 2,3-dioxygenase